MSRVRFDLDTPVPDLAQIRHVHILAIGGAGMSAVARLFLDAGIPVSGSDSQDSATLADLAARGARVFVGHDAAHLGQADTVVVSSAIRLDNVELVAAQQSGRRILHRAHALSCLSAGRRVVAIAGASGKTSTTSMLTDALRHAGADPTFAIGGDLADLGVNAARGSGPDAVLEADESDGSFLVYHPQVAVVTNVQADHLDFYGTYAGVQAAYAAFAETIHPEGTLVTCLDDAGARQLAAVHRDRGGRVISYGIEPGAQFRLADIELAGLHSRCRLVPTEVLGAAAAGSAGEENGEVELVIPAPGEYNLANAAGAFLAATAGLGYPPAPILAGLAEYGGVRRRFEIRGEVAGVRVVDDYAHNPAKVAAVISTAARLAPPGRLIAVFQPHLYSRTRDFAADFAAGLAPAQQVVVLDVYAAREEPIPGVSGELVTEELIRQSSGQVHYVPGLAAAAARVGQLAQPGDLVVTIGAGDVTDVAGLVLTDLASRAGTEGGMACESV